MNTQLLFCKKVNKQLVKLGKYFTDFNFSRFETYHEITRKLEDAKISHFKVIWELINLNNGTNLVWFYLKRNKLDRLSTFYMTLENKYATFRQ